MSSNSTKPSAPASTALHDAFLVTLISLISVGAALGGFLIGRHGSQDSFINKISAQSAVENTSLFSAGSAPITLSQILGDRIDDPLTAQGLARMYDVPAGDRAGLVKRLSSVIWQPPYRPAPFVGHMARPFYSDDLRINMFGFRDERQSYLAKPEKTVRVFITGGSTAWGSGASSQKRTISYVLEQILNERVSPATGYRYEVISTAFPAWSTTQEKLLIQQRLVDMHPDVILMFSGNNDVHWALQGRDVRWFYSYMDQNYLTLINEMYKSSGHPEWVSGFPAGGRPVPCSELAPITARNVADAAFASDRVKARLIFALQPNVVSTGKRLSKREQQLPELQNKVYWDSCYQDLRDELGRIGARNYRLIDLSKFFGDLGDDAEVFVDSYHYADQGYRLVAQALADQIDWRSIVPGPPAAANPDTLKILRLDPAESTAGQPFNSQSDGKSLIRIVPDRVSGNLVVIFDQAVLPAMVADGAITVSVPPSLYATKGEHKIYVADSMTGEISPAVVFQSR
jgi:lysophospholipase L1-like esterase